MLDIRTHLVLTEIALNITSGSNREVNPTHAIVGFVVKAGVLILNSGYC
jgi:hypothetical protein